MRKLSAIILSLAAIYGITLIPQGEERGGQKTLTYNAVNNQAVRDLQNEITNLQNKIKASTPKTTTSEVVSTEVAGKDKFLADYNNMFEWMKENKILYRHQVARSFEGLFNDMNNIEAGQVETFNRTVAGVLNQHLMYSRALKFSPEIVTEFQERLKSLAAPLEVKKIRTSVPNSAPGETVSFEKFAKIINDLKEERTVSYMTHGRETSNTPFIWVYLAGLAVGVLGFATMGKSTAKTEAADKSEVEAMSGTMKRVLKELNYPVIICDSNFNINWQNTESEKLNLSPENVQNILSDSKAMERYELDARSYSIKVEELKYKSGKVSYVVQMVPQTISPRVLSNIVNSHDIERVLENSLQETKDFKGLNQLVAENTVRMNYLFKVSAKVIDVDFDENLSECFIESNRLNDAVREFMMANYHLIKDDSKAAGLFLRTSEKGQRFNLNCFIPGINKDNFATSDASKTLIQKLSSLESKFNLYYPRVSFRWISTGEAQGVDICMSLENKSELESLLKESNA